MKLKQKTISNAMKHLSSRSSENLNEEASILENRRVAAPDQSMSIIANKRNSYAPSLAQLQKLGQVEDDIRRSQPAFEPLAGSSSEQIHVAGQGDIFSG